MNQSISICFQNITDTEDATLEEIASSLEVTVDYLLMEFMEVSTVSDER